MMRHDTAWPVLAFLLGSIGLLSIPRVFSFLDSTPVVHRHRLDTLDGLRGVLASFVFFHHYFINYYPLSHNMSGGRAVVRFFEFLGPAAVSMFFMITGFLFWAKITNMKSNIDWARLFIGRLFRISPLYLVVVLIYLSWVTHAVGLGVVHDKSELLSQIMQWLSLGLIAHPTTFLGQENFLGLVGQTWTLSYEWSFYLSLPLLAYLARQNAALVTIVSILAFIFIHQDYMSWPANNLVADLMIGMITAHCIRVKTALYPNSLFFTFISLAAFMLASYSFDHPYQFETSGLCGICFIIIALGNNTLGLITTSGAKRLGNISYSIYLTHTLVINALYLVPRYRVNMGSSGPRFWVTFFLTYLIVVAVSALSYYFIELTGINLGRKVENRLSERYRVKPEPSANGGGSAMTVSSY